MLLMSTSEAGQAIGAKCGGSAVGAESNELAFILNLITARVEKSFEVDTLTRDPLAPKIEYARLHAPRYGTTATERASIRLRNAFLTNDPVVVLDPLGVEVDPTVIYRINRADGIVVLNSWMTGTYEIHYASGFLPEEAPLPGDTPVGYVDDYRVLQNIPAFMKSIASSLLVSWYRTNVLSPRLPKDKFNSTALNQAFQRELASLVYGAYMRPRSGMILATAD